MMPTEIERLLLRVQKPARYCGGEINSVMKEKDNVKTRIAFCFPDLYEVGMSHLGMKLFYSAFNEREDLWCERVFAPAADFREELIKNGLSLYGLESFDPLKEFDLIMFTIQYEMCYTTILDMLSLSGIPLHASERKGLKNMVMGGGPCTCNPEPIADFFDLFFLGEGEEVDLEVIDLYNKAKDEDWSKERFLREAAQIEGIYVPSLYDVTYHEDGTVAAVTPKDGAPARPKKRIMTDFDATPFPDRFVVPYMNIVHDRAVTEVLRGCIRGCRFCQAGYIYRPFRERSARTIDRQAHDLCVHTGYDEVSLSSLSTSDHSELENMMESMLEWAEKEKVDLSLPSLRIDSMTPHLLELLQRVRRSGLTYAPEAGSQRLRDAINKNITEQEVMDTCRMSFEKGYTSVKLYFMMGLPTEGEEDVRAIIELAQKIVDMFYHLPTKPKGKGVTVTISVACFVPKPFTPFQFEPQDTPEEFKAKQRLLLETVKSRKITVNYHDAELSRIEAILARGDRRLAPVVERVFRMGGILEGWTEHFAPERWYEALEAEGLSPDFYACRRRAYDEVLPWDHLDYYVSKEFFIRENKLAHQSLTTPNCRERCSGCGVNREIKEKGVNISGNCPCVLF